MTWHSWSTEAFARAKEQGKLVFAVLGPLPPESLRQAEGALDGRFVAVLADPATRPDAAARIGAGRALVLGADGARRGELALPSADLEGALARLLREAESARVPGAPAPGPVWTGAVREKPLAEAPAENVRADVFARLPKDGAASDDVFEALLYAAGERRDAAARKTLLSALEGARLPADLSALARRARLLWDVRALTGDERWRLEAEAATLQLLRAHYDAGAGAFALASGARVYPADGNALAALALLRAAAFDVADAAQTADRALTFLQTRLYDPLLGLVHAQGGDGEDVHGLLGDAAWAALAFTEAFLATGVKQHREFADGLLRFLFQELWEREGGGFLDRVARAEDPAILREPRVDPATNAVAFEVCWRLHHLKGNANYRRWLDWGLRGAWPAAGDAPESLAALARAADIAAQGRADFELVGRPGEPRAAALLAALRRHFLPRAIVSFVDPDDQDYILAHKLDVVPYPRLFGCGADLRRLADTDRPDGVAAVVDAVRAAEAA